MAKSIVTVYDGDTVAWVRMNRPDRRNAFNSEMVEKLNEAFTELRESDHRCVVLTGEGKAFSAGADLEYMKQIKSAGREANRADAMELATLLETIYTHPKPVIARVNGPAIGGGLGLIAACDVAVASVEAFFAFSEVRLGLVPAVIGPYVVKAIGERASRRFMLTGDRFDADRAVELGLVDGLAASDDLDRLVDRLVASFVQCGPEALKACKQLIQRCGEEPLAEVKGWTAELIADLRAGMEGQEGMASFLGRHNPSWHPEG